MINIVITPNGFCNCSSSHQLCFKSVLFSVLGTGANTDGGNRRTSYTHESNKFSFQAIWEITVPPAGYPDAIRFGNLLMVQFQNWSRRAVACSATWTSSSLSFSIAVCFFLQPNQKTNTEKVKVCWLHLDQTLDLVEYATSPSFSKIRIRKCIAKWVADWCHPEVAAKLWPWKTVIAWKGH